jgi:hypothetical protein
MKAVHNNAKKTALVRAHLKLLNVQPTCAQ